MTSFLKNTACFINDKVKEEYCKDIGQYINLKIPDETVKEECLMIQKKNLTHEHGCASMYDSVCTINNKQEENVKEAITKEKQIFEKCYCENKNVSSKNNNNASSLLCKCVQSPHVVFPYKQVMSNKKDLKAVYKKCVTKNKSNDSIIAYYQCHSTNEKVNIDLKYPCEVENIYRKKESCPCTFLSIKKKTFLNNRHNQNIIKRKKRHQSFKSRIQPRNADSTTTKATSTMLMTTKNSTRDYNETSSFDPSINYTELVSITPTPEFYEFATPEILIYKPTQYRHDMWYTHLAACVPLIMLLLVCYCKMLKWAINRTCLGKSL